MTLTMLLILLVMPFLVIASGFCSAVETALFGLSYNDRLQLRRLAPTAASSVERLLRDPRVFLVTLLLANMSVNSLIFVLSSVLLLEASHPAVGAAINTAVVVVLILFGEMLPKLLAGARRVLFCRYFATATLRAYQLLAPLGVVVERMVIAPVSRLFAPVRRHDSEAHAHAGSPSRESHRGVLKVDELDSLLELGTTQGAIDRDEQALLAHVIELGQLRVWDVMTPRVQIRWIDQGAAPADAVTVIRQSGHRYLPVYRGSPDTEIVGMLDARRFLAAWAAGADARVTAFLFPAHYVPEHAKLDQLLAHFHRTASEIALCVDEYGTIDGLISLSDAAGRFVDSLGTSAEAVPDEQARAGIVRLHDGAWRLPGRLRLHELAELFDLPATSRASTVGGLLMETLGRIPRPGDRARLGTLELVADAVVGNLVVSVTVRPSDHVAHSKVHAP